MTTPSAFALRFTRASGNLYDAFLASEYLRRRLANPALRAVDAYLAAAQLAYYRMEL